MKNLIKYKNDRGKIINSENYDISSFSGIFSPIKHRKTLKHAEIEAPGTKL